MSRTQPTEKLRVKSPRKVEGNIRDEANELIAQGVSAAEFSARFFGPEGKLRALWTNETSRKGVVQSQLYKWLQRRLAEIRLREAEGFEKEISELSGRITIVIAKSLHWALKGEAALEGVSQSEMIRLKLAVPYRLIAQAIAEGGKPFGKRSGLARKS
ncbi:MAG: hypothetical protein ACT4PY_14445 [Armatimonadota bacterium]